MRIITKTLFAIAGAGWALSLPLAQADESAVYFPTGSSAVKPGAVKKIVKSAGDGASYHVSGWTDPRGSEEINRRLRADRAEAVKRALVAAGVSENAIQLEDSAAGETGEKNEWKLRRASIRYEGGHGPAVAQKAARPEASKPEASKPESAKPESAKPEVAAEKPAKGTAIASEKPTRGTVVAMNTTRPSTTEPTGTDLKPAGGEKKLEHIKLLYWRALNHSLWIIAKQKGFFEQEGFDVDLEETDQDARQIAKRVGVAEGVENASALERGQKRYAAGAVCGFATHEAMAHGDPIVDIGSMVMLPETLLMKKDVAAAIDKDIRAFKGLKIGDTTYGAGEHEFKYNNVLRVQLEKVGLKDETDFSIKEYKDPSKEFEALAAGQLDVAKVFPPADIDFIKTHPEYVRVPFAKFFPYLPCCRQVVTRSQLKGNREKYVRLLKASILAHKFVIEHPTEAAELIGKWLHIPAAQVRSSIMSAYVTLTPDPMRKGVELYQRTNDKYTKTKTSTAEFIDTSLYRDALYGLADEDQNDPRAKGYYGTMITRFKANN